jgi:flagellar biosynthesis regulator FlaF
MNESDSLHIFISYARDDRDRAHTLRRRLNWHENVSTFMIDDLEYRENWREELRSRLIDSDLVVVLLSAEALESERVLQDLGAVWGLKKPAVIVRTGPTNLQLPVDISDHSSTVQFDDFQDPERVDDLLRPYRKTPSA